MGRYARRTSPDPTTCRTRSSEIIAQLTAPSHAACGLRPPSRSRPRSAGRRAPCPCPCRYRCRCSGPPGRRSACATGRAAPPRRRPPARVACPASPWSYDPRSAWRPPHPCHDCPSWRCRPCRGGRAATAQ
eukprot:scaffold32666_cov51-Phaeocystis_antarctica.AAC.2